MNTKDIRAQIKRAFDHEKRTGNVAKLLANHLARMGVSMTAQRQAECLSFVKAYIQETPDIMDTAFRSAKQAGAMDSMRPIFDAAVNYWAEPYDLIPDNLGLIGLTDDAYLTRLFIETISNLHQQRAGHPLLSVDLGPANRVMHGLIGEPTATQLDAIVGQTAAGSMIQAGLEQLLGFEAGFNLDMAGYDPFMTNYEIDRAVDVKLGAMGVV